MKWFLHPFLPAGILLASVWVQVSGGGAKAPSIPATVTFFSAPTEPAAQVTSQTITALPASTSPKIDGNLDDEAWQHAAVAQNFRVAANVLCTHAPTTARITFDDKYLYVAWECTEPLMESLRARCTARDGNMAADDHVEVLLDTAGDLSSFFSFTVNPAGALADSSIRHEMVLDVAGQSPSRTKFVQRVDHDWDSKALLAVGRTPTSWTVEMAIPCDALGLGPLEGSVVHVNFRRFRATTATMSAWAFSSDTEYGRPAFGRLTLGGGAVKVRVINWGPPWIGQNNLKLQLANVSDRTLPLRARVSTKSERRNRTWTDTKLRLRRGRKKVLTLPYRLLSTGRARQQVVVELLDRRTKRLLWKNSVTVRPPKPLVLRAFPWVIRPGEPVVCFVLCRIGTRSRDDAKVRLRLVDRSDGVVVARARLKHIEATASCVRLRRGIKLLPGPYAIGAEMVDSDEMTIGAAKEDLFVVRELDYSF